MRERDALPRSSAPDEAVSEWKLILPTIDVTERLGEFVAEELQPGDLVTFSGGLGAGKTTLARAIIRALAKDPGLEVPSPTFTLLQNYDTTAGPVVHADFYRLAGPGELRELGWEEISEQSIVLVEWPERAEAALNRSRLDIALELAPASGPEARKATFIARGAAAERFARARALQELLHKAGWADAVRQPMQGDASTRAYERLVKPSGETAILMISPPRPDGPPVRRGKPYSAIARLAESIHAFVAMDRALRALGFSAPRIYGEGLDAGLLILEDLGNEPVVSAEGPIPERYAEATRLLARLHGARLPNVLPVTEGLDHVLPPYDLDALMIEVELLVDWYGQYVGQNFSGSVKGEFGHLWREILAEIVAGPTTWTLRDYHSPNLIWLSGRSGLKRVGLLDFQDAVLGHPAYDVASLLQDARVTVPPELEIKLLSVYARERKTADAGFDMRDFARAYAIMGAQRATKVLGIFARLDKRDGKPHYLAHMPRVEAYLARNLNHPGLLRLRTWYQTHLPRLVTGE